MLRSIDLMAKSQSLVTNARGEYAILPLADREALQAGSLTSEHARFHDLLALGMIDRPGRGGIGLEAAAERTRKAFLLDGPALHIFVVTLRCDHACGY